MRRIYFDNAATTTLSKEVLDAMMPYLTEKFGNPSSIYSYGRETRLAVEKARKSIAGLLHANPGEMFFTSGGTESTNTAITTSVRDLGCRHIITSPIEHHATMHVSEFVHHDRHVKLSYVKLLPDGHVDLNSLENLLKNSEEKAVVSLMHANNEIGNLLDIETVGELCNKYKAIFHCDTVQTVAHYPIDLKKAQIHFANAAAHKFHGPKGTGILFISEDIKVHPYLHGGAQERNMRGGTENVYGIVGMAKAMEIALAHYEEDSQYIQGLKAYMAEQLQKNIQGIHFNGDWNGKSLYTVLNVSFPKNEKTEMLLYNLDIHGICASGGSACSSGADTTSHVITAVNPDPNQVPVRFSFSGENTKEEIDAVIGKLKELI